MGDATIAGVVKQLTDSISGSIDVIFACLDKVLKLFISHELLFLIILLPVGFFFVHWVIRFLRFRGA